MWDPTPIQFVRVKSFDFYQTLRPSRVKERAVAIVDIDDASLAALGQWPWPRTLLARLHDKMAEAGAVVVGYDIVFAEPDRYSPDRYAESMSSLPGAVRDALRGQVDNDVVFSQSLARSRAVLGVALVRGKPAPGANATAPAPPIAVRAPRGVSASKMLIGANAMLANIPVLQKGASSVGMITPFPEFDGVVRRVPAVYRVGKALHTALAIELIRIATGGRTLVLRAGEDGIENIVFSGVEGQSIAVPTDQHGRLWVHFSPHDPSRYVSAKSVLDGTMPRDRLEGRIVLVGTSAVGLLDLRATPLTGSMPGVEVHAQLIENILFQDFIARPFYADAVEFFAAFLLSLILIAVLPRAGALWTLTSGFVLAAATAGAAWFLFTEQGLLFDVTFPLACSLIVFTALAFYNYVREERQKRWVRGAFTRYLSPRIVDQLAEHPERLNLGGEMRPMTLLFSDVRGFTSIAERFDAAGLTAFMNRYLTPMTEAILRRGGTVDKYIGDAIMAFWNAPLDDPEHALNACRAALDMQANLARLNAELAAEAEQSGTSPIKIAIGIGINSAECCVGNMGSEQRFDYSVLGDGVNLAARLEGQTKQYGVTILLGEDTQAQAPGLAALELDLVQVKGKTAPARIFTLLGDESIAQSEGFRALATAQDRFLVAYRRCAWDEAEQALGDVAALGGAAMEGPCRLFAARIEEFRRHPPPADWNGVHIAETK